MIKGIWWIKRDIRLLDNVAFTRCLEECTEVLLVFIFEPDIINAAETSVFHLQSIVSSLEYLRDKLEEKNSTLLVLHSDIIEAFSFLHTQFPFQKIYSHEETGTDLTYSRDKKVGAWCKDNGIEWKEYYQTGVIRRLRSRQNRQEKWLKRMHESMLLPPQSFQFPADLQSFCYTHTSATLNKIRFLYSFNSFLQKVSERDARLTFQSFLHMRSRNYRGNISSPNTAFVTGSRLSPHLSYGTISTKTVYQQTLLRIGNIHDEWWKKSLQSFLSRLHWKDHFIQRLEDDPSIEFQSMHPLYREIAYENSPFLLHAWLNGTTGYPLVDACTRCLQQTGFINFRMRAMITSFACYVLHLDWRYINYPLACLFTDYEPGIHISQLQMQAGVVGTNTIRVYSPKKQLLDQDPHCTFVKQWIPELRSFTYEEICDYENRGLGSYPTPIVPYNERVSFMKDIVYGIKKSEEAKAYEKEILKKFSDPK